MKVTKWWKLPSDESYQVMKVASWLLVSSQWAGKTFSTPDRWRLKRKTKEFCGAPVRFGQRTPKVDWFCNMFRTLTCSVIKHQQIEGVLFLDSINNVKTIAIYKKLREFQQTCKESQQQISSWEMGKWQRSAELSLQCMAAWSLSPELNVKGTKI